MTFSVRFWGVRGSIACPSPEYMTFGGNTSCIHVTVGETDLILDIGTGGRMLGRHLLGAGKRAATVLLSHTHWDHISGFPFFAPAYRPGFKLHVMAGHLKGASIREVMAGQMAQPMFPVPMDAMCADLTFEDFRPYESFDFDGGVKVRTVPLNHPGGAIGYRIEHAGKSLCYITDTEHVPGRPDQAVLAAIADADVVVYDATYTDEEYPCRAGWGHSTWQEGARLCRLAGAKKLILFHHDPDHDDRRMIAIERAAQAEFAGAWAAREGAVLDLL